MLRQNTTLLFSVRALNPELQAKMTEDMVKETDSNIFTFTFPEIIEAGEPFKISVDTVLNVTGKCYHSLPIKKVFATKPLHPEKLMAPLADDQKFVHEPKCEQIQVQN